MSIRNRFRGVAPVSSWLTGGGGRVVKSVQRGTITITNPATSNTATITAVDTSRSRLRYLGLTGASSDTRENLIRLEFTSATTITAIITTTPDVSGTVSFEVTEYWPGVVKSIQRGTITDSTTATIAAVDMTKAELDCLGQTSNGSGGMSFANCVRITLTNATTITQVAAAGTNVGGWQVVEWL